MGSCVSQQGHVPPGSVVGVAPSKIKVRLGDKLFEKRDRCVDLFARAVSEQIDKSLSQWSTRGKIKQAYDDGIFRLFIVEATPTTRLFLERSIVKDRLSLSDENPLTTTNTNANTSANTNATGTGAAGAGVELANFPAVRRIDLLQYEQTEETLTRLVADKHGLGVYLQPIENTSAYGVWIAWHRQQHSSQPDQPQQPQQPPRKFRLNEGLLNSTIPIGGIAPSLEGR